MSTCGDTRLVATMSNQRPLANAWDPWVLPWAGQWLLSLPRCGGDQRIWVDLWEKNYTVSLAVTMTCSQWLVFGERSDGVLSGIS